MFDWWRKKQPLTAKQAEAYQAGGAFGKEMADAFRQYTDGRWQPVFDNY